MWLCDELRRDRLTIGTSEPVRAAEVMPGRPSVRSRSPRSLPVRAGEGCLFFGTKSLRASRENRVRYHRRFARRAQPSTSMIGQRRVSQHRTTDTGTYTRCELRGNRPQQPSASRESTAFHPGDRGSNPLGVTIFPSRTASGLFSIVREPKPVALLAAIMLTLVAQRISGLAWAKVQRLPSGSAAS